VALRISILGKILLFAWAQSPPSPTTAAASNACAEARTELASAFAVVASLEAQLNVARKMLIERRLAAAQCELNASTAPRNGAPRELTGVSSERIAMAKESQAEVGATVVPNPLPHRPPLGFGSACHIGTGTGSPLPHVLVALLPWLQLWMVAAHGVEGQAERNLRRRDDKATVRCNFCLTFQRVTDYAIPRSVQPTKRSAARWPWVCGSCRLARLISMRISMRGIHTTSSLRKENLHGLVLIQVHVFSGRQPAQRQSYGVFQVLPLYPKAERGKRHWAQGCKLALLRDNCGRGLGVFRLR
jgi:hypothetical protein